MEILIEESKIGALKLSSLVIRKFIYMLLTSENYQLNLEDVDVSLLETSDIIVGNNNNIIAQIKLIVNSNEDLVSLKNKVNKLILKRVESVLNLVLLNIHIIFIAQSKKVETHHARTKKNNATS